MNNRTNLLKDYGMILRWTNGGGNEKSCYPYHYFLENYETKERAEIVNKEAIKFIEKKTLVPFRNDNVYEAHEELFKILGIKKRNATIIKYQVEKGSINEKYETKIKRKRHSYGNEKMFDNYEDALKYYNDLEVSNDFQPEYKALNKMEFNETINDFEFEEELKSYDTLEFYEKILSLDGNGEKEIEHRMKNKTFTIFSDFEENLSTYLIERAVGDEDVEDYKNMIDKKIPLEDWGIVEYNGKIYYISYEN